MNRPRVHVLQAAFLSVLVLGMARPGSAGASDPVPFNGTFDGQLTFFAPFSPGSSPECNANFTGDPSAPGAVVTAVDNATGRFSSMGAITLEATSCVDPNSPYSQGHGVILTASGDRVFIEFDNMSSPDPDNPGGLILNGSQWVNGGTGRFEGATGTQTVSIELTFTSRTTAVVHGSWSGTIQVDEDLQRAQPAAKLEQNSPNPFNPQTEIRYSMTAPGRVQLTIYDVQGRLVRSLVNGTQERGEHRVSWNGVDDSGGLVASGVYFYRLTTNGISETRKLIIKK